MKSETGEKKYAGFAAKLTNRIGSISAAASHDVEGFRIFYNPTDAIAKIDGVRLRPRSGVVKTASGHAVIRFDEEGGITYDSKLAGPLLDVFKISRDD